MNGHGLIANAVSAHVQGENAAGKPKPHRITTWRPSGSSAKSTTRRRLPKGAPSATWSGWSRRTGGGIGASARDMGWSSYGTGLFATLSYTGTKRTA
jgi:hypothetical protein